MAHNGWREVSIDDVIGFVSGGTPSKDNASYWNGTIPWVSAKDMKRLFLEDTEDHISEEGVQNGTRLVQPGTAFVLTRGMTLLNDVPICVALRQMAFNQDVKAATPKAGLTSDYLPYLLLGSKQQLLNMVDLAGHGTGRINTDELKSLLIPLPQPAEQLEIARVMRMLDDKIELNRKMNQTLEAMARALFQSWFVDFDPIRAKAEGRDPGLPAPIADLFPDSFEDSELGPIPKGWAVRTLAEEFDITMGQSPPGSTYNEEGSGMPFFQGRADFGFRFPRRRVFCNAPTRFAAEGDTLVSVRAPVGDLNMAFEECSIGRGVAAVRHLTRSRSYTYYTMRSLTRVFDTFEAEGKVFGSISKKNFHAIERPVSSRNIIAAFDQLAGPIDDRIKTGVEESDTLVALRDSLLPKLISGEVRVDGARRAAETGFA